MKKFESVKKFMLKSAVGMQSSANTLKNREEGQGMVEYGLIIALIAVVVIAALLFLGPKIAGIFTQAGNSINNVA